MSETSPTIPTKSEKKKLALGHRIYRELFYFMLLFVLPVVHCAPKYQEFQEKARAKEGLTLLNAYYYAAKATEAEQGKPPTSLEEAGFNVEGQWHYQIYVSPDKIPAEYRDLVPVSMMPSHRKNEIKVMALGQPTKGKFHMCTIDQNQKLECLTVSKSLSL